MNQSFKAHRGLTPGNHLKKGKDGLEIHTKPHEQSAYKRIFIIYRLYIHKQNAPSHARGWGREHNLLFCCLQMSN